MENSVPWGNAVSRLFYVLAIVIAAGFLIELALKWWPSRHSRRSQDSSNSVRAARRLLLSCQSCAMSAICV